MDKYEEGLNIIIEKIKNAKNPFVFFDVDSDGSMSYLMLKKGFSNIDKGFPLSKDDESIENCLEMIDDSYDLYLFFDTPYIDKKMFEKINGTDVVWVDHHPDVLMSKYKEMFENVFVFNPLFFNEKDSRPSSYWAFRLNKEDDFLFYAVLGSLSDFFLLDVIYELYDKKNQDFKLLFKISDEKLEELFDFMKKDNYDDEKMFDKRREWINYMWFNTGFNKFKMFFDLLYKLKKQRSAFRVLRKIVKMTPKEFVSEFNAEKSQTFYEFNKLIEEYEKEFKKACKKNMNSKKFLYYHHKDCSTSFNRQISEELLHVFKDAEFVMSSYEKSDKEMISCSFRSKKLSVPEVLNKCLEGLNGRGGGHPGSGGCSISRKDFDIFMKRIKENC